MSFLLRRKKVFLFAFLLCLLFVLSPIDKTYAQSVIFPTKDQFGNVITTTGQTIRPASAIISDTTNGGTREILYDYNKDGVVDEVVSITANESTNTGWVEKLAGGLLSGLINAFSPLLLLIFIATSSVAAIFVNIGIEILQISLNIGINVLSQILTNPEIRSLWEIFRNLGNVALVFILLYIAISTILQQTNDTTKLLGKVIVAGILMNFSFLFGAVIVDVSNVLSLNIYNEIEKNLEGQNLGNFINEKAGGGIAGDKLGVDAKGDSKATQEAGGFFEAWGKGDHTRKAFGYLMLTILDFVLAIVLFSAAIMILGRMVAIIFLLLISPIAFASNILPSTEKNSKDWWSSIINQSFFLPVFLLFVWVGIKTTVVVSSIQINPITNNAGSGTGFFDLSDLITNVAPEIVKFALIIGIFIAALTAANKISSKGSALVNSISATTRAKVGGALLGTGAFLGRNTFGKVAKNISEDEKFKNWAARSGATGSLALNSLKNVAGKSFDFRESKTFSGVATATGVGEKAFGGASGKGGYKAQFDRAIKRRVSIGESFSNELTDEQKAEKTVIQKQMTDLLETDVARSAHVQQLERQQTELDVAEKSGNLARVKQLKNDIKWTEEQIKLQENRIKATEAYKKLQEKEGSIKSQRATYAERLKNPKVPFTNIGIPTGRWIPFTGIGPKAADKILKGKGDDEKLADIVKKMIAEEEKKKGGTP